MYQLLVAGRCLAVISVSKAYELRLSVEQQAQRIAAFRLPDEPETSVVIPFGNCSLEAHLVQSKYEPAHCDLGLRPMSHATAISRSLREQLKPGDDPHRDHAVHRLKLLPRGTGDDNLVVGREFEASYTEDLKRLHARPFEVVEIANPFKDPSRAAAETLAGTRAGAGALIIYQATFLDGDLVRFLSLSLRSMQPPPTARLARRNPEGTER